MTDIDLIGFYVVEVLEQLEHAMETLNEGDKRLALLIAAQAYDYVDGQRGVPIELRAEVRKKVSEVI